jgi:hypothetical protein
MTPEIREKFRAYLLGSVTEAEREEIETTYLVNDEAFEELEIAEAELVDDYLRNKLPAGDRQKAESNFLVFPDGKQELSFSSTLRKYASEKTGSSNKNVTPLPIWKQQSWLRTAAALVVLIIVGALLWILWPNQAPRTFVSLTLPLTTSSRGESEKPAAVKLPLTADALKLTLQLPDETQGTYKATLVTSTGEEEVTVAEQDQRSVTVIIPGARLRRGAYALRLTRRATDGSENRISGSYFFTVE